MQKPWCETKHFSLKCCQVCTKCLKFALKWMRSIHAVWSSSSVVVEQSPTRGCNKYLAGGSTSCGRIYFHLFLYISLAVAVLLVYICEFKFCVLNLQFWFTWSSVIRSRLQLSQCLRWQRLLCLRLKVWVPGMILTCSYVQMSPFGSACVSTSFHLLATPPLGNDPLRPALGRSEHSPAGRSQNWVSIKERKE